MYSACSQLDNNDNAVFLYLQIYLGGAWASESTQNQSGGLYGDFVLTVIFVSSWYNNPAKQSNTPSVTTMHAKRDNLQKFI